MTNGTPWRSCNAVAVVTAGICCHTQIPAPANIMRATVAWSANNSATPCAAPATTPVNNNPIATLCRIATVRCCPSARKPCQSVALSESAQTATKPMLSNHGFGMTPQPPYQIIPIHPSPILILMTITRCKLLRNNAGWRLTLSSNHMSSPAPITAATIASHA